MRNIAVSGSHMWRYMLADRRTTTNLTFRENKLVYVLTKLILPITTLLRFHLFGEMGTSGLQTLPREILLNIQSHLPPSSKVLLNYVSHHFYRSIDYNMDDFHREHEYPKYTEFGWTQEQAGEAGKRQPQRLELLCLLERDHLIRQSRAVCSVCGALHGVLFFPVTELQKNCTTRQRRGGS